MKNNTYLKLGIAAVCTFTTIAHHLCPRCAAAIRRTRWGVVDRAGLAATGAAGLGAEIHF